MTVKEYLNRPFELNRKIKIKTRQLEGIRALLESNHSVLSDMPKMPSPDPHRVEGLMAQALDLELELEKDNRQLGIVLNEVCRTINAINNASCEEVLTARYVCFKDWVAIAQELDYSKDWIFRLHKKGLNLIKLP